MQQTNYLGSTSKKTANAWTLILICGVFAIPFLLGSMLYFFRDGISFANNAKGEILVPSLAKNILNLPIDSFLGKWQLLYFSPLSCDAECQQQTHLLQNLCSALGKDKPRVVLRTIPFSGEDLFLEISSQSSPPFFAGSVVIVDPKGWLVTHYTPTKFNTKGILDDLRRLMRYSYVG